MAKLIMLSGLPGSGKSTKAEEIIREYGNFVRLNKDLLRKMLHFDKWTGYNESLTRAASTALVREFLVGGVNVVIDDTNLGERHLQSWKEIARQHNASFEHIHIDTPYAVCIERDKQRDRQVGRDVIFQFALQYGLIEKPQKGYVLCDLDGTLADTTHRQHFLEGEKKDWKGFFSQIDKDPVRQEVLDMVIDFEGQGYDIIFVSARPETYREVTEVWLERAFCGYIPHKTLIMRRASDKRPDTEVKQDMLNTYFKEMPIHKVIDDRPSVIKMWREHGLDVIDVGNGIDF